MVTTSAERAPLLVPKSDDYAKINDARRRIIVTAGLLTGFLSTLDLTIVATCVPTISSELNSADREAWIGTAYLWSNVTFTPLYGRLSDILGRKAAYLQAMALFTGGTLFCGVAPSFSSLAFARFIAGMGGGGMGTVASVLLSDIFEPKERGFFQGLTFATFGAGMGLGGPVGGFLTQQYGWRAAFYAQIPIAIIAILLVWFAVPSTTETKYSMSALRQIDFGGSFAMLLSIGALLQLLSRTGDLDKSTFSGFFPVAMMIIFPFAFIAFIAIELRFAAKPVLPLSLLSRRVPLCVGIIAGVIAVVNFNMLYHLPTVFEIVFRQPLSYAGAHLLPNSVAMTVSAPVMGWWVKRTNRYKWATTACCTGPIISMALIASLNENSGWVAQWLSVVPMGAGFSGLLTLTLIAMLNTVNRSDVATATGFVFVFRSLGQVFGVGLSGAVYQASLIRELVKRITSKEIVDRLRHASSALNDLSTDQQTLARRAYAIALRNTFLFGMAGAAVVLLVSLLIPDDPLPAKEQIVNTDDDLE